MPKSDIPALIQQLGGDTYAGRNEASRRLAQIGGPALPELRLAMTSTDAEIRRRAKRLVNAIERNVYAEVRRFEGHGGSVNAVAFSPDGKRAASGDSSHVRLWEVATGKELLKDDTHRDRVMAVAFSPDGKYLATGSEDRKVLLYDAATLRVLHTFRRHRADVRAVAFTPDGKRLVSADLDGGVFVWSVPDGKPLGKLPNDGLGHVLSVVPIDDKHVLLCPTNDNSAILRAIDPKDAAVYRFDRHTGKVVARGRLARRQAPADREPGQHAHPLEPGDAQIDARAERPHRAGLLRRRLAGRQARRLRRRGQGVAAVGPRRGQGDPRPAGAHEYDLERGGVARRQVRAERRRRTGRCGCGVWGGEVTSRCKTG